jgi:hypothetical protein
MLTKDPQAGALVAAAGAGRSMSEMLQEKPAAPLNFRDRVEIRHSRGLRGRIVEPREPIGSVGIPGYRVVVRRQAPGTKPIRPTSI